MSIQKNTMKSGVFGFFIGAVAATMCTMFFVKKNLAASEQKTTPPEIREVIKEKIVEKCSLPPEEAPLPPPQFAQDVPEVLKTNHEGEVRLSWLAVDNANKYQINLISEDGKKLKTWKTSKQVLFLSGIPFREDLEFTPYKITLQALNAKDEAGPESSSKNLLSRRLQNIVAPTIKSISIED